ncbi:MAG: NADPH-dependent FMN reductase [Cytophaga sp.]|uniref:NADPH-dependent FMN reductase n=1 Tax=Cytophaga sp. TaxID=29535 RepID=UPI003F80D857
MSTANKKNILALSGSVRKGSANERILQHLAAVYADCIDLNVSFDLSVLPHFNPDLAENLPVSVQEFISAVTNADGVIICTPEYVFSIPAVLKNALEWTVATTVFSGKPCAIIVASSLGDKAFESLDLIMKTLIQQELDPQAKVLIQGARSKISAAKEIDTQTTAALDVLMKSLLKQIQ